MTPVKVSVCMVTYNQEQFIAQAVESALMQRTSFPFEIVIGEDCSTDSTRSILQELAQQNQDKIRLRLAPSNRGGKANFIETFGQCRGQYVVILEGDDFFVHPDKLQLQADALDVHPEWSICFHPALCEYENGQQGPAVMPENWHLAEATIHDLLVENFIPTSGAMFRNNVLPELPRWFHEIKLGDWPLHILNAAHGKIGFMPEPMSAYRIHSSGIWSNLGLADKLEGVFRMLTEVDRHFAGAYQQEIEANRLNTVRWLVDNCHTAQQSVLALQDKLQAQSVPLTTRALNRFRREFKRTWSQLRDFLPRTREIETAMPSELISVAKDAA